MIGKLFFLTIFILIVFHTDVSASSLNSAPESEKTVKVTDLKTTDPPCLNTHYEYKKFRPNTEKDLPFPPGAVVVVNKCLDESVNGKIASEEELKQAEIDKENAVRKLSILLSYIYHQQKNLVGSYEETDQAYDDLTQRKVPIPEGYDRAVTNYETALKILGEYQAYLSAVPRAVSDYEEKVGSSFKEFSLQKEDGLITMMKTSSMAALSKSLDEMNLDVEKSTTAVQPSEENKSENGGAKNKEEARQNLCGLVGAFGGATLFNPLSTALGASLGATLCSESFYKKMTLFPRTFKAKVVDMGAYIKDGLEGIGHGLYNIGKKYLYVSPSKTSEKISEHFNNAKSWMNRKLGWQ